MIVKSAVNGRVIGKRDLGVWDGTTFNFNLSNWRNGDTVMNLKRNMNSKGIRCVQFWTFQLEAVTGSLNGNTE